MMALKTDARGRLQYCNRTRSQFLVKDRGHVLSSLKMPTWLEGKKIKIYIEIVGGNNETKKR